MRYAIHQRMLSFGDDFWIMDENGNKRFYVDGAVYSFGNKLTVQDIAGRELARIKQRLFTLLPTYQIFKKGKVAATIHKKLLSFRRTYVIDLPAGGSLEVKGSFIFHDYEVKRKDKVVAYISKKLGRFTDCYGVDVSDGEDDIVVLCCAIVIDMMHAAKKRHAQGA